MGSTFVVYGYGQIAYVLFTVAQLYAGLYLAYITGWLKAPSRGMSSHTKNLVVCESFFFLMGVSGWRFLLVPAHPGSHGQRAIKWLYVYYCCVVAYIIIFKIQRQKKTATDAESTTDRVYLANPNPWPNNLDFQYLNSILSVTSNQLYNWL